jgi:hypothetical protein
MQIAALLPGARVASRLVKALPTGLRSTKAFISFFPGWEETSGAVALGGFELWVVDPTAGAPRPDEVMWAELLRFRAASAGTAVVLYVPIGADLVELRPLLEEMGFAILVTQGFGDDPRTLLRSLACALVRREVEDVMPSLEGRVGSGVEVVVPAIMGAWPPHDSVQDLARRGALSPSSLGRHHRAHRIPCPRECLRWRRCLEVAALGRLGVTSGQRIAFLVGLAHESSLCRLLREVADCTLKDALHNQGLRRMVTAFQDRILSSQPRSAGWSASRELAS